MERIRQIHTSHLRSNLEKWAAENEAIYLDGYQLVQEPGRDFPLGWMLCDSVRNTMTNQVLTALRSPEKDHLCVLKRLEDHRNQLSVPAQLPVARVLWPFERAAADCFSVAGPGPVLSSPGSWIGEPLVGSASFEFF